MRSKSRQLDELLPRFPQQSAHCCHSMYNLYRPAALGKGGSITQGSHHRPIRSGQEREEEEEEEKEEEKVERGEEVWRSNLFVMIYIKTEGRREKREEPQITMEIHNGVKECVEKKKE